MIETSSNEEKRNRERGDTSMKYGFGVFLTCMMFYLCGSSVYGAVTDYETVVQSAEEEGQPLQTFSTEDGSGGAVTVAACSDTVYVTAKTAQLYPVPGQSGTETASLVLGDEVKRTGVCDNGWSKVSFQKDGDTINGYMQNQMLSTDIQIQPADEEVEVKTDSSILDFPGRKDGEVVGEVLELDEVKRTGTVNDVWSRIEFLDGNGTAQTGYIPTSCLDLPETVQTDSIDEELNAGTLHEGSGEGLFADALEAGGTVTEENGVQVGTPVAASSDANLKPLGTFRITHYCPCSICCGPWANGITSTGVTATTNHTIAVDPTQIPYGSQVVINGQVYVAEDCGGAIKTNCIDIYVATHAEGEAKGVYYTDVYLIQ